MGFGLLLPEIVLSAPLLGKTKINGTFLEKDAYTTDPMRYGTSGVCLLFARGGHLRRTRAQPITTSTESSICLVLWSRKLRVSLFSLVWLCFEEANYSVVMVMSRTGFLSYKVYELGFSIVTSGRFFSVILYVVFRTTEDPVSAAQWQYRQFKGVSCLTARKCHPCIFSFKANSTQPSVWKTVVAFTRLASFGSITTVSNVCRAQVRLERRRSCDYFSWYD